MTNFGSIVDKASVDAALQLSAQYLVAGEMLRRGWPCILSLSETGEVNFHLKKGPLIHQLDIKVTKGDNWKLGSSDCPVSIFVHISRNYSEPPSFFILRKSEFDTARELRMEALKSRNEVARRQNEERRQAGERKLIFIKKSTILTDIRIEELERFRGAWDTLAIEFGFPRCDWVQTPS